MSEIQGNCRIGDEEATDNGHYVVTAIVVTPRNNVTNTVEPRDTVIERSPPLLEQDSAAVKAQLASMFTNAHVRCVIRFKLFPLLQSIYDASR